MTRPTPPPVVAHETRVPLADSSLAELSRAVSELYRRGVPYDAHVGWLAGLGAGALAASWETLPVDEQLPSRGVLLVRRLRSGVLALVRLRRG